MNNQGDKGNFLFQLDHQNILFTMKALSLCYSLLFMDKVFPRSEQIIQGKKYLDSIHTEAR